MSESSYDRIKSLCDENGIAVTALETRLGYGRGYIGKMRHTKKIPSDRIKEIADYFGVSVEYLMTGEAPEGHYINEETAQAAQKIFENKELRLLFETARNSDPEDIKAVHEMLLALKRKEQKNDFYQGD